MKPELLRLKAGKGLILGVSIFAALFMLNSCTKEELIKKVKPQTVENPKVDPVYPELPTDTLTCGGFRTQTQGGWGSTPHGNNPGSYVHKNFAAAFPYGLTVGCTYKITLTSAQAVTDYLPAGGNPAVLTTDHTNPKNLKNNLASQLVALTLSVQFDAYDPQFSSSSVSLGNLLIGSGAFKGWTISQVIAEANSVLGGCASPYTATQIADVLAAINENFVDGTKNGGFVVCPDSIGEV